MIKKVIFNNQVTVVKKTEVQSGGFANETVEKKGTSDKLIPRKNGWDTNKYGGCFKGKNDAYCILFKGEDSKKKKGVKKNLLGISIMNQKRFEDNPKRFLEELGYVNIQKNSIRILPKYTLFEMKGGKHRRLASNQ